MINYKEYEQKVYNWLTKKNEQDPNFTFSLRQKGSKGAETDYFIGKENSRYFATTFWTIPVGYPGSSGDCIDIIFKLSANYSTYSYNFEFNQTNSPDEGQNTSVLNLIKSLVNPLEKVIGNSYVSPANNKIFTIKTKPKNNEYSNLDEMIADIDQDLNLILPIVDECIEKEILSNPKFIAHRISQEEFSIMKNKLEIRFEKHKNGGINAEGKVDIITIPQNITKEHIEKAIQEIDKNGIRKGRNSSTYDIEFNEKFYPPKLVISIANRFANGEELDPNTFAGGENTEAFELLKKEGFKIVLKKFNEMPISLDFSKIINEFLEQAKTEDLKTKDYPKTYGDLKIKVSFGAGNQAEIPWIALLKEPNKVTEGIYPVYLYFKREQKLILAYGLSETNKPITTWNLENPTSITNYYYKNGFGKPKRYGSSYIYKVYDIDNFPDAAILNDDLDNIIKEYMEQLITEKSPIVKSLLSVKEILLNASQYIKAAGFKYHFEEIANFYLSLRAKPFVILAGISGTGKTQLPRKFGESLGFDIEEQIIQVPVRPDWTDGSELLGYTSLDNIFSPKDLTLAIQKAILNPDKPYFFILDEMNLARVEHYFSDYLSIIETRRRDENNNIITDKILREEMLVGAKNSEIFKNLRLPPNLYLIGTVNMDETTHSFSRKVLDRANSIEMNDVDLNWIEFDGNSIEKLQNISNDIFDTTYLSSKEISKEDKESIKSEMKKLIDVNHILEKADLHFAYRVRDEVAFYLILNKKHKLIDEDVAFDFQLVQKILPRIHGSSERVQKVLIELLYLLEKGKNENVRTDIEFSEIEKQFPLESLNYKRSSKKILFMLKRFDDDRFTSFWL